MRRSGAGRLYFAYDAIRKRRAAASIFVWRI
jgi:hypothetical protein